jgi:hypothetical protein
MAGSASDPGEYQGASRGGQINMWIERVVLPAALEQEVILRARAEPRLGRTTGFPPGSGERA